VATVATGPVALRGASARVAWRVTVAVDNAAAQVQATTLTPVVQAIVVETERQLDPARADGDLGRFNKTTSRRPQPVSGPALAVVEAGLALGRQTSGAFDITAGPLRAAWSDLASPPDGATLQIARARTGLQRVLPEKGMLKKDVVDLEIDASAIIDSVAVDGIAAALRERGFSAFAIEVGGAALAVGRGADGPWSVGLPVGAAPPVMPLDSASGGGRAMALAVAPPPPGTIDPRSGRPVAHDLERCVVIGEDVVVVDGLAEACLVLGSDGLLQTLRAFPGVEAGWLRRDGSSASTPGFPSTGLPSKG
jgi:thiamine biosynthesis lipoprotein